VTSNFEADLALVVKPARNHTVYLDKKIR
jgi:hypothetical protein